MRFILVLSLLLLSAPAYADDATTLPPWLAVLRVHAEQGNEESQDNIGDLYFDGKDVKRDYVEAAKWYHMAAGQGSEWAQHQLEAMYKNGLGVKQDNAEAYYRALLAEKANPDDPFFVDHVYYAKRLTPEQMAAIKKRVATWSPTLSPLKSGEAALARGDYQTGWKLLRPLAERGNAEAQGAIGWAYKQGKGVKQDDQKAAQWFTEMSKTLRKEANQGDADAQQALWFIYQRGAPGVKQDYAEAYFWYSLLKINRHTWMKEYGLSKELFPSPDRFTPEQLARIKRRVEEWKPTPAQVSK